MRLSLIVVVVLLGGLSAGCIYRVTDPVGGRSYTTNYMSIRHIGYAGGIDFVDRRTGDEVVLQQYQLHQISEQEATAEESTADSAAGPRRY